MAVYTRVAAETLADFLTRYDLGRLVSFKGIAEGVENSNYLVETTGGRFILTLYEKRVDAADLPYFLGLTAHLAAKGLPVPAPVEDREGQALQTLAGRPACLIEFLPGVSISEPTLALASAAGRSLAELHLAAEDYPGTRDNGMALGAWQDLATACGEGLGKIDAALPTLAASELEALQVSWPTDLPSGTIHADLFPDNVLVTGDTVTGLIDFYFACDDALAYDLAITHAAWAFDDDGEPLAPEVGDALLAGYDTVRTLSQAERVAFPLLCRGAALRFTLTRAYDWINTPADAMVTRKDPMAFARRLQHYRTP
ncbi:MAG: homoserine kinase [Pacificimonas sp.]